MSNESILYSLLLGYFLGNFAVAAWFLWALNRPVKRKSSRE